MASPISRKDAEYQYYSRVASSLNIPKNAPLSDFKKIWWSHVVGASRDQTTASDLEFNWLGTFSGVTGKTLRDRWEQAFVSLGTGIKPPSTMEELQAMFYTFAP